LFSTFCMFADNSIPTVKVVPFPINSNNVPTPTWQNWNY
jgi:hypothetical protein